MAKSKSTGSAKSQSAAPKRKSSATNGSRTSAATRPAAPKQPAISSEDIGHTAGEIWSVLNRNGGQSLASIKKSVDAPTDLVLAAIGWLAREDKLEFAGSGRTVKISLR